MGSFNASVANDFLVIDGTEAVSYTFTRLVGGNPVSTTLTIPAADPHDYTRQEISGSDGVVLQAGDRQWGLGAAPFPAGFIPQRGDSITDSASVVWMVIDRATIDSFGVSWFVPTRAAR